MDFGNLSVTEISDPIRQNVTNAGNIPMNITVRGYGGDDWETGQNLSMICDNSAGVSIANITFDYMRFGILNFTPYVNMTNITNQSKQIFNLTVPKRTESRSYGNSSNSTWWRLQIPAGAGGLCNGTVVFSAVDASD